MKEKYIVTMRLLLVFTLLQAIQMVFPPFAFLQIFSLFFLGSYKTLPLFFTGIIMHMLSHGSWGHLLGNLSLGLPAFLYIEHRKGGKALLKVFLLTGLAALFTQIVCAPTGTLIGSSGAVFGCFSYACIDFSKMRHSKILGPLLLLIYLMPQIMELADPFSALMGIAYAAHVGGSIMGIILSSLDRK